MPLETAEEKFLWLFGREMRRDGTAQVIWANRGLLQFFSPRSFFLSFLAASLDRSSFFSASPGTLGL